MDFVLVIPLASPVQTQGSGDDLCNLIWAEGIPEVVANGPLRGHIAHEGENDMQVLQRPLVRFFVLEEMTESCSTDSLRSLSFLENTYLH